MYRCSTVQVQRLQYSTVTESTDTMVLYRSSTVAEQLQYSCIRVRLQIQYSCSTDSTVTVQYSYKTVTVQLQTTVTVQLQYSDMSPRLATAL